MRKQLKRWIARKLYNLLKSRYTTLENFLRVELRQELQEQQFALAVQKIKALHERRQQGISVKPNLFDFNPDSCNHLKGGRFRSLSSYKDYAVRYHTFADGSDNIKCTICGKEWTPGTPGWAEGVEMWNSTTNTRTASEVHIDTLKRKEEQKWTTSSIIKTALTGLRRHTSQRKGTRKRS